MCLTLYYLVTTKLHHHFHESITNKTLQTRYAFGMMNYLEIHIYWSIFQVYTDQKCKISSSQKEWKKDV